LLVQDIIHNPETLPFRELLKISRLKASALVEKIKIYKNYLTEMENNVG